MGTIGISYIGILFLLMLIVPNIMWAKHMPQGYEQKQENKILVLFERIGQVCVSMCAIIFTNFNFQGWNLNVIWLLLAFVFMLLYEGYWIHYFHGDKTLKSFYSSYCGIPVAGATLPIIAFLLLGIYGQVIWMIIAVILLGTGHIGIHLQHRKECL